MYYYTRMSYKEYGPYTTKGGYRFVVQKHDDGHFTSIYLHRRIMEEHLGRKLTDDEVVHHVNETPGDDRIENLEVKPWAKHTSDHHSPPEMVVIVCPECHKEVVIRASVLRHNQGQLGKAGPFCGRSCAGKYGQRFTPQREPVDFEHGTANAYDYHKCRCDTCRAKHSEIMREWRRKKTVKS
jgi:hypothetical protein